MNVFKFGVLTCLALMPFSVPVAAAEQSDAENGINGPSGRMAFPAPEHLRSSLPGPGRAESATKERGLERAARFRRDTVDIEPFRAAPPSTISFERLFAEPRSGWPPQSQARPGSAVLKGAPVAPAFPSDPPPALKR